jgi:hypothetical protein
LSQLCKGESRDIVRSVFDKNGFECWRLLTTEYGQKSGSKSLSMLQKILRWEFAEGDSYKSSLTKWENLIMEYERDVGENIKEDMKCAILVVFLRTSDTSCR